ncbi:hypothetical protein [Fodinibius sediminis]|uniref:Uncharacterized protein n=1 Tax=Fodinibius sediminis TaxID=1214077 RepID=A0A521BQ31_9BACT|nr:hypothetical protein [Fodinibius sediminis]SMO49175.1 hypothetical protein SAMN06265218_103294 [Fodinibius sediminis]
MIDVDRRLQEYYITKNYKGFYKIREKKYHLIGQTHITFSNGEKEIFATGLFREGALEDIFNKVDAYYSQKRD